MAYDRCYRNPKDLEKDIQSYFKYIDNKTEYIESKQGTRVKKYPYTIAGLCVYLDISDQTLLNYEKQEKYREFFGIVKKAKKIIENRWIELGATRDIDNTMAIFVLKNGYGYRDKQEIKQDTTAVNTNYNFDFSDKSDQEIEALIEKANNGEDIDI